MKKALFILIAWGLYLGVLSVAICKGQPSHKIRHVPIKEDVCRKKRRPRLGKKEKDHKRYCIQDIKTTAK